MARLRAAFAISGLEQHSRAAKHRRWAAACAVGVVFLATLFLIGTSAPVLAQAAEGVPQTRAALEAEFDVLFQRMLKDPSNLDVTFRFAEVAAELGNYEAAISAYERMLLFNPDLPRVKFELGVLYFRLGSFDVARSYFTTVQESAGVPPEIQARIISFLAEIDARSSAHKLSGSLMAGVRYQSNANVGSGVENIFGGGTLTPNINPKEGDWNGFGTGTVSHSYDLGLQNNATIETNGLFYYAKQANLPKLDLALMEVNTGPRFDLSYGDTLLLNLRPYALANDVLLDHYQYLYSIGSGLEISRAITDRLAAQGSYEFRFKRFANSPAQPTAYQLDSVIHAAALDLRYALLQNGIVGAGTTFAKEDARNIANGNREIDFRINYTHSVDAPFSFLDGPLVVIPGVYRIYTLYDARDTTIVPEGGQRRDDREWRYSLTVQLGVYQGFGVNLQIMRQVVNSTVINYKYNNSSVTLGLMRNF